MKLTSWAGTGWRLSGPHRRLVVSGKSRADLPIFVFAYTVPATIKD